MIDQLVGNGAGLIVLLLIVLLVCLWVAAARSIVVDPGLSLEAKALWVLVIIVAPYVGVIVWFAVRRARRPR